MVNTAARTDDGGMRTGAEQQQAGPRLTRSVVDRRVAGVAGGIGRHFGIDPTLVRVAFVVLTVMGGSGVALYLIGWLLLPEDGAEESKATSLLRHHDGQPWDKGALVLAVVAGVVLVGALDGPRHMGWIGPIVVITVVALLLSRRDGPPHTVSPPPPPPPAGDATDQGTGPGAEPGGVDPLLRDAGVTDPFSAPAWAPAAGTWPVTAVAPPVAAKPPVTVATLSALIALAGGVLLLDAAGLAHVGVHGFAAAALVVVGVGLLASAWLGRAWGLIPVAVALGVVVAATSAPALSWRGGFGDRTYHPTGSAGLDRKYRLAAGDMTVDLTGLQPAEAVTKTHVTARVGVGHLLVRVPADERIRVHARTGAGNLSVLGENRSGTGVVVDRTAGPEDGSALLLDLETGFGQVEVERV
jgi:phage shock protein PspC (stress-responsive transcriptional regulator)